MLLKLMSDSLFDPLAVLFNLENKKYKIHYKNGQK
jgi:hypothetical protein